MAFLEERISVNIQHGFSYEDDYTVQITRTSGGNEYRHLIHPYPIRTFTVRYIADRADVYTEVANLYHKVYGKFAGFRAKVLDDFSTNGGFLAPTHTDEVLVYQDGFIYQLVKRYGGTGNQIFLGLPTRTIYKPVGGTVKVGVNGVDTLAADPTYPWSVDYTTGMITFVNDMTGLTITAGCEFDIPVRFDSNVSLKQDLQWRDTSDIKLVELLNPFL